MEVRSGKAATEARASVVAIALNQLLFVVLWRIAFITVVAMNRCFFFFLYVDVHSRPSASNEVVYLLFDLVCLFCYQGQPATESDIAVVSMLAAVVRLLSEESFNS